MKFKIFSWALFCLAVLIFLAGLIELRARNELDLARTAGTSDLTGALKHYTRALSWYVPFGAAETAAEELLEMGLSQKNKGSLKEAELALSRMRAGLYGARSFYTPRKDLISRAEPHLAELLARRKLGPAAEGPALQAKIDAYLEIMRRPSRPATRPALAASGGFIIWIAAALVFIARFARDGIGLRAWPWALVWALGFVLWVWGMKWA